MPKQELLVRSEEADRDRKGEGLSDVRRAEQHVAGRSGVVGAVRQHHDDVRRNGHRDRRCAGRRARTQKTAGDARRRAKRAEESGGCGRERKGNRPDARRTQPDGRSGAPLSKEMGSVALLSREGEIEIAKRIEEGKREIASVIYGMPMTIEFVLALRDQLKNGKIDVREIVPIVGDGRRIRGGGSRERLRRTAGKNVGSAERRPQSLDLARRDSTKSPARPAKIPRS